MVYLGFASVRAPVLVGTRQETSRQFSKAKPSLAWREEMAIGLSLLQNCDFLSSLPENICSPPFDVKSKIGMPRKSREGHRFYLGFLLPWRCTNSCFYLPDGLCAPGNSATLHHSGRVREELDSISTKLKACRETSPFKNALLLKPKNIWVPYFEGLFCLVFSLLVLSFLAAFSYPLWTCFSNSCLVKVVWENCVRC